MMSPASLIPVAARFDQPLAAGNSDEIGTTEPFVKRDDTGADPLVSSPMTSCDALTELIATLDAQRAYEADASIFDIGKRLAERTLDIER